MEQAIANESSVYQMLDTREHNSKSQPDWFRIRGVVVENAVAGRICKRRDATCLSTRSMLNVFGVFLAQRLSSGTNAA